MQTLFSYYAKLLQVTVKEGNTGVWTGLQLFTHGVENEPVIVVSHATGFHRTTTRYRLYLVEVVQYTGFLISLSQNIPE